MLAAEKETERRTSQRNRKSQHDGHRGTQKFGLDRCTTNQRCLRAVCELVVEEGGGTESPPSSVTAAAASCLTVTADHCTRSALLCSVDLIQGWMKSASAWVPGTNTGCPVLEHKMPSWIFDKHKFNT